MATNKQPAFIEIGKLETATSKRGGEYLRGVLNLNGQELPVFLFPVRNPDGSTGYTVSAKSDDAGFIDLDYRYEGHPF